MQSSVIPESRRRFRECRLNAAGPGVDREFLLTVALYATGEMGVERRGPLSPHWAAITPTDRRPCIRRKSQKGDC